MSSFTQKQSLPPSFPNPLAPTYRDAVTDRFLYGLTSDKDTWDRFYDATQQEDLYEVPDRVKTMVNTIGFSEYLMFWQCNSFTINNDDVNNPYNVYNYENNDGCCMQTEIGTVCTIDSSGVGSGMNTYRLKNAEYELAVVSIYNV